MALSRDLQIKKQPGDLMAFPVYTGVTIFKGSLVCINSSGYAQPATDAASVIFVGVASEYVDNSSGGSGAKWISVYRNGCFELPATSIAQTAVGSLMYVVNDGCFDETSSNGVICGRLVKYISATRGVIDIQFGAVVGTTLTGASVSITDAGNYFSSSPQNAETVLQEVGAELAVYNKGVVFPINNLLEDGTALTKYSSAPTPGFAQINTSKEVILKWGAHATPGDAAARFVLPDDLDGTAAVEVHFLGCVSSTTNDPHMTCEVYIGYNDTDCGGDATPAYTVANTITESVTTVAAADVPDTGPAAVTVVYHPKDGELGTDDVYAYGIWLEYTKKVA